MLTHRERDLARNGAIYPYMEERLGWFTTFPRDLEQLALAISHRDQLERCHKANNYTMSFRNPCLIRDPIERENFIRNALCSFPSKMGCEGYTVLTPSVEVAETRRIRLSEAPRNARRSRRRVRTRRANYSAGAGEFRDAIDNFVMEDKSTFKVKLFPLAVGDPAYSRTTEQDQQYLSLSHPQGFRIEIYEVGSTEGILLVEGVQEIEMNINCPNEPDCVENQIKYRQNESAQWESYTLGNLVHGDALSLSGYIQIHVEDSGQPTRVRWGYPNIKVDRDYLGGFYMRMARRTNDNNMDEDDIDDAIMEWSLINDIPVEQYVVSVVSEEARSGDSPIEALKAQATLARSFGFNRARRARMFNRVWDVGPTTRFQYYPGIGRQHPRFEEAVAETLGLVLTYRGQPAYTQYHACVEDRTVKNFASSVSAVRTIPSHVSCDEYVNGGGHGYGMPQIASYTLARNGWNDNSNSPSQGAIVPNDINTPWNSQDILSYFYPNTILESYNNN